MENENFSNDYLVDKDDNGMSASVDVERGRSNNCTRPHMSTSFSLPSPFMGTPDSMRSLSASQVQHRAGIAVSEYRAAVFLALRNSLYSLRAAIERPATSSCEAASSSSAATGRAVAAALRVAGLVRAARPVAVAIHPTTEATIAMPCKTEQTGSISVSSFTLNANSSERFITYSKLPVSTGIHSASDAGSPSAFTHAVEVHPDSTSVLSSNMEAIQTRDCAVSNGIRRGTFQKRTFYRGVIDERRAPPAEWVTIPDSGALSPSSTRYEGMMPPSGFAYGAYRVDRCLLDESITSPTLSSPKGASHNIKDGDNGDRETTSFRVSIIANHLFYIGSDGRVRHYFILSNPL